MRGVLILALLPVSALAEVPWAGTWGWGDCQRPTVFSASEISHEDTYCEVTGLEALSELDAWTVDVECHHGGDVYPQRRLLLWADGRLWHWLAGTEPVEMTRCE